MCNRKIKYNCDSFSQKKWKSYTNVISIAQNSICALRNIIGVHWLKFRTQHVIKRTRISVFFPWPKSPRKTLFILFLPVQFRIIIRSYRIPMQHFQFEQTFVKRITYTVYVYVRICACYVYIVHSTWLCLWKSKTNYRIYVFESIYCTLFLFFFFFFPNVRCYFIIVFKVLKFKMKSWKLCFHFIDKNSGNSQRVVVIFSLLEYRVGLYIFIKS